MAIIQLQEPFKSFRGRDEVSGGQVLFPFRKRNVSRTFVNPFNPQSSYQDLIRAIFTALSQEYSNVTDSENAGWVALAPQLDHVDKDGNQVTFTAKGAYVATNFWNFIIAAATSNTAPAYASVPGILTITGLKRTAADTGWQFTYAWTGANTTLALKNTGPLPGLRRQPRLTDFRFSTNAPADATFAITSAGGTITVADTDSRFTLATADRIGLLAQVISDTFIPLQKTSFQGVIAAP